MKPRFSYLLFLLAFTVVVDADEESGIGNLPKDTSTPKLTVEVFSNDVKNATAICFDDLGRLYVCETYRWRKGIEDNRDHTYWIMDDLASETNLDRSKLYQKWQKQFEDEKYFTRYSDRVIRLEDSNNDGIADRQTEFATNFNQDVDGPAIGLLAGQDSIYLTCIPHVWRLKDNDGDGVADDRISLQDGFGVKNSLSGHDLHGLVWGPDGKLYFSMGDRGYNCKTREGKILKDTNSGAAFRCDPDGTNLEIFYYGLRNPQEMAFNEYGDLFTVDNNCDQGDSARVCYLIEGGNAGWDLGTQALTTYKDHIDDGGFDQVPHWLGEGLWKLRFPGQPSHILPPIAHLTNGPSGLVFNSGTSLPDRYKNHFLVCDYKGAPNLCFLYSFRVEQNGAGYQMVDEHLMHGGVANTDVEIGFDGKIYLADFGGGWVRSDAGNIYTLFDETGVQLPVVKQTQRLFREGFAQRNEAELISLLSHDDFRVRLRSQYALAKKGKNVASALMSVARNSEKRFSRFHAIWGLGQVGAGEKLVELLDDIDPEIQAQVVRTLGNIGFRGASSKIRDLILSESPRVCTFAAIAAGKLSDQRAITNLIELLKRNNDRDVYERHAAVFGLSEIGSPDELAKLQTNDSRPVRLGALLALRRRGDERVVNFLNDRDESIRDEAIRAINDAKIETAYKELADDSEQYTLAEFRNELPNEDIFRRLINANLRVGSVDAARRLVRLGQNAKLPMTFRLLALKTLAVFDDPPTIDPTLGIYAPLPNRNSDAIRNAIADNIVKLFESSTGEIASASIQVMRHYKIKLDRQSIVSRIRDGRQPTIVRLIALQQLIDDQDFSEIILLKSLLEDEDPELRNGACEAYVTAFPEEAVSVIKNMFRENKEDDLDFRTAYKLLATRTDDASAELLVHEIDRLLTDELYHTVRLDLFLAAKQSESPTVREKLSELESTLATTKNGVFELTLDGGDIIQGQAIFQNQGVCLKCHKADRGGGDAGPVLTNIARLRRPHEILRSVIEPNEKVVDGFGTQTFILASGKTVAGTPLRTSDQEIEIRTAQGENMILKVDEIEDQSEVTSPMPKQWQNLSLLEMRDLMAFLQNLKGKKP